VINFIQMPADLLFVTSTSSVGDSIRRTMEDSNLYRVHVVNNKAAAIVRADEAGVPIAMIDMALGLDWVQDIGKSLRMIRPTISLVILCDENQTPPALDALRPWVLIRKPFELSDFMDAVSHHQAAAVGDELSIPWLSDETKAAQHLTRITLESSAQAALITRKNDMWAYAGGLSQNAAKEVAQTVTRNWDGQKGSDLLRFIRLESTKAEHMLYATRLAPDVVLALVFDAETPFSTIRSQAGQLVMDLGNERPVEPQKFSKPSQPAQTASVEFEETELTDDQGGIQISDIISNVPSPNPEPAPKDGIVWPRKKEKADPNETRVSMPLSNATVFNRNANPSPKSSTPVAKNQSQDFKMGADTQFRFDDVEVTAPARPKPRPETPVSKPAGNSDVTRESPTTEAGKKLVLEPASAGLYHLTYACLLVPRFSIHYLVGDLSEGINEWFPTTCIAFGWRLEFLAIRPEYLQWVVNVQPNTSPGYLMRVMRQQISEKIFTEFPIYKKENPSGDFWAPGYLIMGGSQPHPPQLVRDYIRQIRQRQGHEPPPK
jgi:REP element-mobilizing transposase RayT